MINYDEKYLKQSVTILENLLASNDDSLSFSDIEEIKAFLNSYFKYQCQKDEKMHGDL